MPLAQLVLGSLVCLVSIAGHAQPDETKSLEFKGYWQGGDLYIQNPYSRLFEGYCALEVYVNGALTVPQANSSAIHVPLENKGHEQNELIEIRVVHNNDCRPRIINAYILSPKPVEPAPEEEETPPTEDYIFDYEEEYSDEYPDEGALREPKGGTKSV